MQHSLASSLDTLFIFRWLLDSAERSQRITFSVITSGLMAALKHSISRHDMLSLTPRVGHHNRSSSHDSLNIARVKKLLSHNTQPTPKSEEPVMLASHTSLKAGYTPSIGSRHNSDYSLVSSTVEAAAFIARSSMRSSKTGNKIEVTLKVGVY